MRATLKFGSRTLAARRRLLGAAILVAVLGIALHVGGPQAARKTTRELPVAVVEGLSFADLASIDDAAVGLLVPGKGPETSRARAFASLVRGETVSSRLARLPESPVIIRPFRTSVLPDVRPVIVVAIPSGGRQPNDRRYPVAILGGESGLLVSPRAIPGVVSITDIAPTALGLSARSLSIRPAEDATSRLAELDRRIDAGRAAKFPATLVLVVGIAALALARGRAAALALAFALATNLMLGLAGFGTSVQAVVAFLVALLLAAILPHGLCGTAGLTIAFSLVALAYTTALVAVPSAVALAPFGPEFTTRLEGVSNLLATFWIVPTLFLGLAAAQYFGLFGLITVGALATFVISSSALGADGGGGIVFALSFSLLAAARLGRPGTYVVGPAIGAIIALVFLRADSSLGESSHLAGAFKNGFQSLLSVGEGRLQLALSQFSDWWLGPLLLFTVVLLVRVLVRSPSSGQPALVAFVGGLAISLLVNDSPTDVLVAGLAGLAVLSALETPRRPRAKKSSARMRRVELRGAPPAQPADLLLPGTHD